MPMYRYDGRIDMLPEECLGSRCQSPEFFFSEVSVHGKKELLKKLVRYMIPSWLCVNSVTGEAKFSH